MDSDLERYVLAAVRKWKRKHPASRPRLPKPGKVAVHASLSSAIVAEPVMNGAGRALAKYVADEVHNATWLMFYAAWETVYELN